MNTRVMPSGFQRMRLWKCLPFSSPSAIMVLAIGILGFWHVAPSLAQFPSSTAQPAVSYEIYQAPIGTPVYPVVHSQMVQQPVTMIGNSTWIVPASYSAAAYSSSSFSPSISSSLSTRNWALDVANAQMNLDPNRLPDLGKSRQRLDQAMMELENFLATSPQHQANWLAFLTWNELRAELKNDTPSQKRIVQFEKSFRQNHFGLEMRQFTSVREALAVYSHALKFGDDRAKSIESFSQLLKKLSEQLQFPNVVQDFEKTREIGQSVLFLAQANQASDLINAIRGSYSRANARVLISSDFVNKRFAKPVNEANPVDEVILGTQIYGQSWLQGSVTPQLLDSNTHAALRLNLNGSFSSQSIGYNRSVKLHTVGSANVAASETIALTDGGLVPLNDTTTDAALASQINDIEARLRIVRKIASKQAAKQKPEADAIAEGRLENRVRTQFHEKLAQQIAEANQKIKTPDLPALPRLGLDRPKRSTWSSSQYLALLWKLQGQTQLGAPSSCPLVVEPTGITVQLHESAVSNLLDPVLAGRLLKNTDLDALASQFGDVLGKGSVDQKESEPWAVTMAMYHPVEIQLDDSLVTFRIRTAKLDRNGQSLEQDAAIEASYKIVLINGAIQLERQGNVKINFFGKQQQGSRAVMLRSFLKKKFDEVFKENLLDQPIRVTDRLPSELRDLNLSSIHVDDGWIQAHVR